MDGVDLESPDSYPQKLDLVRDRVLRIEMDEAAYRSASFLDDRILSPATKGAWLALPQLIEATSQLRNARPLHFIFHTGHVGSTLVSRLLDASGRVLPIREPLPLRTLAEAPPDSPRLDAILEMFLRLWQRGYAMTEAVVLKATSSAARLGTTLLAAREDARAVYLNLRAEPYLATLLAGQNSPIDVRGHAPGRLRRLATRLRAPLPPLEVLSLGELTALSWLTETLTQREMVERHGERVLTVDFDEFLADVEGSMRQVIDHFRLPADSALLEQLGRSPVLTRYSKAPELPYDPQLRAEVLRDSRRDNAPEMLKGLRWLDTLARTEPPVARALDTTRT